MAKLPALNAPVNQVIISGVEVDAALTLTVKLSPELYDKLETKASKQNKTIGDMVAKAISNLVS